MTEQEFYALYKRREPESNAKEIKERSDNKQFEREIEKITKEYE